jgi:hypothetical protein
LAKWDEKEHFWRMDCKQGEEWIFLYVLPPEEGHPIQIIVPTLLQMGWIKSPPHFCAATETAWDVATNYIKMLVNLLPQHNFEKYVVGDAKYKQLPEVHNVTDGFVYMVKVYVDDFMSIVIPLSQEQLRHIATAIMTGKHDVFPPDSGDSNDPISMKKLEQRDVIMRVII